MTRTLGWLLVGGGVLAVLFPLVSWLRARASRGWPAASGRITESTLDREVRHGQRDSYMPRVRYEYTVGGRTYPGSQLNFWGSVGGSRAVAERTTARYPAGARVTVYYNPQDPAEAVLDRAFSPRVLILPPVGLFLAWLGYVLLQR